MHFEVRKVFSEETNFSGNTERMILCLSSAVEFVQQCGIFPGVQLSAAPMLVAALKPELAESSNYLFKTIILLLTPEAVRIEIKYTPSGWADRSNSALPDTICRSSKMVAPSGFTIFTEYRFLSENCKLNFPLLGFGKIEIPLASGPSCTPVE